MYSAVKTNDFEYPDTDMEDRDSIYFDTISVAGSEPNRKSLSLSRQTIYHSAVDLPASYTTVLLDTPKKDTKYGYNPSAAGSYGNIRKINTSAPIFSRQSTILDVGDYTDNSPLGYDEVSAHLIDNSSKVKKLPITYSQWKTRVTTDIRFI